MLIICVAVAMTDAGDDELNASKISVNNNKHKTKCNKFHICT